MPVFLLALAGAVLPCLAWLWFFYSRDKHDPEPIGLIIGLFLMGAFPVAFVAGIVNSILLLVLAGGNLTFDRATALLPLLAIVIAPITEETLKYGGASLVAGRNRAFNEPVDGIIYGTTVGLGFAAAETTDYLIGAFGGVGPLGSPVGFCEAGFECFTIVAFLRGIGSAVLHATASGIAGYGMSRRKEGAGPLTAWSYIGLAILVHGLWNALSFLTLVIPCVIYAQLVKRQLARSPFVARAVVPRRYYDPRRYGQPPPPGAPYGYGVQPPPPRQGPRRPG